MMMRIKTELLLQTDINLLNFHIKLNYKVLKLNAQLHVSYLSYRILCFIHKFEVASTPCYLYVYI